MITVYIEEKEIVRDIEEFLVGEFGKIVSPAPESGIFSDRIFQVVKYESSKNIYVFPELKMSVNSADIGGLEAEIIENKIIKFEV